MVQSVVQGLQGQNNQVGGAYEGIRDQRLQNGVNGVGMQMNALVNRPHSAWYNVGQGLLKAGLGVGTSLLTGGFSNLFGGGGGGFGGIDHGGFGH
jgi:hypothetical protein